MAKAIIINKPAIRTKKIKTSGYSSVRISEVLPFRVRFETITVPGYSSTNIPGIGIQVIGFSNYIL
jgi:hypothetical protein